MMELIAKLGGRKFVLSLFSVLAVALGSAFGIPESAVMTVGGIVVAYVWMEGKKDVAVASNPNPPL